MTAEELKQLYDLSVEWEFTALGARDAHRGEEADALVGCIDDLRGLLAKLGAPTEPAGNPDE